MHRRAIVRVSLVVSLLVAATACQPPSLRSRAKAFGAGMANLGAKTVAIVKPLAPKVEINADMQALATDTLRAKAEQRIAAQEPIVITKSVRASRDDRAQPSQPAQRQGDIPVTITRTQAPPTVFVLRGTTFGGRAVCEQFTAMAECTASCTDRLKLHAMTPRASVPSNGTQSCSCMELDSGC